jgi:uncharacterized protein YbjT (DUF2867 family)
MNLHLADLKKCFGLEKTSLERTGRILIVDGHNVVGYRVVDQLAYLDYPMIRVGVRNTDDFQVKRWEQNEYIIERVTFDWNDESTYNVALEDVKTVFVTTPMTPGNWDVKFPKFLDACHRAKVKKIVKLSFYHSIKSKAENPRQCFGSSFQHQDCTAAPGYGIHDVPFVKKHALCDGDLILRKEFDTTIIFATHLMSNVFRYGFERQGLMKDHEFYGASQGKHVNYVSPNDVADIAMKAIFDDKGTMCSHTRQGYNVLGPFPLMDVEVAALLSESLHTAITYVEKPIDFFDKDTAALENIKASGMEKDFPHGDFKRVMNRSPQSFREYLKETDRMSPVERKVVGAFHPMKLDELKVFKKGMETKEEIEPADDAEGFEVKAAAVEKEMDNTDQAATTQVAQ